MKKHPKLCNSISQRTAIAGWAYYAFELLFLPGLLLLFGQTLSLSDAAVNFIYYLLNFTVVLGIFKDFILDSLAHAARHMAPFLRAVALGFLCCWAANYEVHWLMELLAPAFANVNDQAIADMFGQHPVLIAAGTIALVPLSEECLFRGLIFSQLRPKNRALAYAVSSLAFCAVHVVGYAGIYPAATLALCFLQYIPAGLFLAWAYDHSGSIIAPIFIHAAVNAVSILALR